MVVRRRSAGVAERVSGLPMVVGRRRRAGGAARVGGLARDGRKRSTRIPRQTLNPGP